MKVEMTMEEYKELISYKEQLENFKESIDKGIKIEFYKDSYVDPNDNMRANVMIKKDLILNLTCNTTSDLLKNKTNFVIV